MVQPVYTVPQSVVGATGGTPVGYQRSWKFACGAVIGFADQPRTWTEPGLVVLRVSIWARTSLQKGSVPEPWVWPPHSPMIRGYPAATIAGTRLSHWR